MKKNFFLYAAISLVLLLVCACAFQSPHNPLFQGNGLQADPALTTGRLENGFRYVLLKNNTPEDRVSVRLDVQAGSMNETDEERGAAHYLEHMLFNGSTHFKEGELIEFFQSIGMAFGADANAHTGFFETVYKLSLPRGEKDLITKALTVIDDYARGALLEESAIDKERGIILAEKRERDSVSYRTFKSTFAFELPDSRLSERFPIGTREVIKNADRSLLKGFYDTWYRPENFILVMVGDYDTPMVEKMIQKRFSELEPRAPAKEMPPDAWHSHSGIKPFYHYEKEAGNTEITIETVSQVPFKAQTLADLKDRTVKNIADRLLDNRLSKVTDKKGDFLSDTGVSSGTFLRRVRMASVRAETAPEKWEETLGIIEQHLRQALIHGFTESELERVKKEVVSRLDNAVERADTRKSSDIVREIVRKINRKEVFQSPEQRRDILKPFVASLDLSRVNEAFCETWSDDHRLVLVTGNAGIAGNKKAAEKRILSVFSDSRKRAVDAYQPGKQKFFPYLADPAGTGTVLEKRDYPELGITTLDYENGARLNFKKSDFKKGKFLFKVVIPGGLKTAPLSKPGIDIVAEDLIHKSGLGRLNRQELEEAVAGRTVDIRFRVEENCFSFIGSAAPSEVSLVFQLIYAYLKDPGFREKSLALVKTRYEQMYRELIRTPRGIMNVRGKRFLAGGDSRFGLPEPAAVKEIRLEDVKAWLAGYFDKGSLEVSVAGDFDPEAVKRAAGRYIGTLQERRMPDSMEADRGGPVFPTGETRVLEMDTRIDKSTVRFAFLTDDFWDINRTRALSLLSRVLSERLRENIREKLGASYSPYVYSDPSLAFDGYGILHAVIAGRVEEIDLIRSGVKEIVSDIVEEGVNEKELELARKPVLNHIKDMRRTNSYWLNSVLSGALMHPEKFRWAETVVDVYTSLSAAELTAYARQYLDFDKEALIIIKPAAS